MQVLQLNAYLVVRDSSQIETFRIKKKPEIQFRQGISNG
jgi:hypothetical protein